MALEIQKKENEMLQDSVENCQSKLFLKVSGGAYLWGRGDLCLEEYDFGREAMHVFFFFVLTGSRIIS